MANEHPTLGYEIGGYCLGEVAQQPLVLRSTAVTLFLCSEKKAWLQPGFLCIFNDEEGSSSNDCGIINF